MVTKELFEHIKNQLNQGAKESEIRQSLLEQGGWTVPDIDEAFATQLGAKPMVKPRLLFGLFLSVIVAIVSHFSLFLLYIFIPGIAYLFGYYPILGIPLPIIVFILLNSLLLFGLRKTSLKKGIVWGYVLSLIFIVLAIVSFIQINKIQRETKLIIDTQMENMRASDRAVEAGDLSLCEKVKEGDYLAHAKANCYKSVALKNDDPSICDKIRYSMGGDFINPDDCKDEIYYKRALDKGDISQCLNMFTVQRDFCLTDDRLQDSIPTDRSVVFSIEPQSGPIGTLVTIKGVGLQYINNTIVAQIFPDSEYGGYGGYFKAHKPISNDTREVVIKIDNQVCADHACSQYISIVPGKYLIYAKESNPLKFTVTE